MSRYDLTRLTAARNMPISSISSGVSSSPRTDRATNSAVCSMAGIGGVPASSSICLAWVVSLMLLRSSPSSMQGTSPLAISLASAELARSASCSLMISNATVLYASNVPFIVLSVSSLFPCSSMFPVGNISQYRIGFKHKNGRQKNLRTSTTGNVA